MASLQELLAEEGFEIEKSAVTGKTKVKLKGRPSFEQASNSRRLSLDFSIVEANIPIRDEAAIDEVSIRAVISILCGFVGQYLRDQHFRNSIKEKCYACFIRNNDPLGNGIFADMELAIENIERLVDSNNISGTKTRVKLKSLQYSISLLTIVASLNENESIHNAHLSACARLYLSIVYKLQKNDRTAATHLLQVFLDSPFFARTCLLPQLWEHLFLPHLLHFKIWHSHQLQLLSCFDYVDKVKQMKVLNKVYDEHLDIGTTKFALYYKQWLKIGAHAPALPSVPLPSTMDSCTSNSSINKHSLYRAVFGPSMERKSVDAARNRILNYEEEEEKIHAINYAPRKAVTRRRSSSQSFKFFNCQSKPVELLKERNNKVGSVSVRKEEKMTPYVSNDLSRAIFTVCSSDSLSDCELAIRLVAKFLLDSHGERETVDTLSTAPVIEGIMNVLFASEDDEILELAISILAELVTRKEINGQLLLNLDPQLDIFLRLLTSSSLFLKAAILLYLLQPKAKQMISIEWIPLVLRVLEFGDQLQTLFTVQRSPQEAAYYLLDQLLTGFDEDKNFENSRQVVSLGGLSLLLRRAEIGDVSEKIKVASVMYYCIQSNGKCRHYLAKNLNKDCIFPLLLLQNQRGYVFALLKELLCIDKQVQRLEYLHGLVSGKEKMNSLHILLVYLQRAQQEERPIIAAILLQLDLLGDPNECSVYREEVIEEVIKGLDCQVLNEKVQVQSASALLMLGSCFSYAGEAVVEQRLLKEAGYDKNAADSYLGNNFILNSDSPLKGQNEEEEAIRSWQRRTATVLLKSGGKRLLAALVDSVANGIPCLGRASLVTISWMSCFLGSVDDVQSVVSSDLIPELIKLLKYSNAIEEKVLASFSLLRLDNHSDYLVKLCRLDKKLISDLHKLSDVTWTAKELVSIISSS